MSWPGDNRLEYAGQLRRNLQQSAWRESRPAPSLAPDAARRVTAAVTTSITRMTSIKVVMKISAKNNRTYDNCLDSSNSINIDESNCDTIDNMLMNIRV